MKISVRPAKKDEWKSVLNIQRRAIHEIACTDYSPEVLNSWGSSLNKDLLSKEVADFETKAEQGIFTVVAEVDGILAGFGEVVPKQNLLLAIYINPDFKRQGVGTKILSELERITKKEGADFLRMDSSLTTEHFYVSCGYQVIERGFHTLSSAGKMACIKMKKNLA